MIPVKRYEGPDNLVVSELQDALADEAVQPGWPVKCRDSKGRCHGITKIRTCLNDKGEVWMVLFDDPN